MSLKYHGVIVPEGTDLADGPKAFRDLTDFGNAVSLFATLTDRDAWASPPDGAVCIVLKSSGVAVNTVQQYSVGVGWRSYDPTPIGVIQMYTGAAAPSADWLLCNGQAVPAGSEYDALRTLVGATVPDLRDRFVLGAGPKAVGATGGASTVALTTAQMPVHSHGGTSGLAGAHTPTATTDNQGSHAHAATPPGASGTGNGIMLTASAAPSQVLGDGGTFQLRATYTTAGLPVDGGHTHAVTVAAVGNHNHTVAAEGSGTAHENMPPYYVLSYIVRAR